VYEGGIRVPSVLEWPAGIQEPGRSELNAVTSDVLPTLAELTGQALAHRPLDGISLAPLLAGKPVKRPGPIFFWHYDEQAEMRIEREPYIPVELQQGTTPLLKKLKGEYTRTFENYRHPVIRESDYGGQRAVLGDRYKLVIDTDNEGRTELFDIREDPNETQDLADKLPEVVSSMQEQLNHWQNSVLHSLTGGDYLPPVQSDWR
jgi:arylsulfatase A-like enzyme